MIISLRDLLHSALAGAAIPVLAYGVVQSDRWDLPSGRLLETVLSSCQFVHSVGRFGAEEHMICPTRFGRHDFPQVLKDAVVASEDKRFFVHGAVDLRSIVRAAWLIFWGDRQGGSTITHQLARSIFLKNEDSLGRKLVETVLAVRIFALLPRDEILTRYMNVVPHARNMYGFDDPARYYVSIGVQDLNLAEAALLVGMLPEPNKRDPLKHPTVAFESADRVLLRMFEQKKITPLQAASARRELKRRVLSGKLRRGDKAYTALEYRPYRDLAIREANANGIKLDRDYRLIVFIDPEFQRSLGEQLCSMTGNHQAAGFFMRPSGEALAVSGSCIYAGEWNRATDMTRSIGSTGKLFPLIGAYEASVSLKRQFSTRPVKPPNWPAEANARCTEKATISLEFALAQSCNRPWTEMAIRLGPRLTEIVGRFDLPRTAAALVPLGGIQTSPMKLAQAYAALKNNGRLPQVRFLIAVIGAKGNIVGTPAIKEKRRVMLPATALAVLRDLRGPVKWGTASGANSVHALVYGKTGTSSRNWDALFVGLTEDFVGSFWLGFDRPTPMPGVHGGGAPARAFSRLTDLYYLRMVRARFAKHSTS